MLDFVRNFRPPFILVPVALLSVICAALIGRVGYLALVDTVKVEDVPAYIEKISQGSARLELCLTDFAIKAIPTAAVNGIDTARFESAKTKCLASMDLEDKRAELTGSK